MTSFFFFTKTQKGAAGYFCYRPFSTILVSGVLWSWQATRSAMLAWLAWKFCFYSSDHQYLTVYWALIPSIRLSKVRSKNREHGSYLIGINSEPITHHANISVAVKQPLRKSLMININPPWYLNIATGKQSKPILVVYTKDIFTWWCAVKPCSWLFRTRPVHHDTSRNSPLMEGLCNPRLLTRNVTQSMC